jgi:hypothetical protein
MQVCCLLCSKTVFLDCVDMYLVALNMFDQYIQIIIVQGQLACVRTGIYIILANVAAESVAA